MGRLMDAVAVLTGRARVGRRRLRRGPGDDYWYSPVWGRTSTGIEVDEESALDSTAIYAGVTLLADCMALLPKHVYRTSERGRRSELVPDHPLDRLISLAPNPAQSAFEFWRFLYAQMKVRGCGFAEIQRDSDGRLIGLWPLLAANMKLGFPRGSREPVYVYTLPSGEKAIFQNHQIFRLSDFNTNGLVGESNLLRHRESVGLTLALEQYAGRFFSNGGMTGAVLIFPEGAELDKGDKALFRKEFEELNSGLSNAHRVAIVEEGASYTQVGVSPKDSQAIDCRTYQVGEASRMLRVPRVMLGDLADAHQKNVENLFLQFVTITLDPLAELAVQQLKLRCLGGEGEADLEPRFATTTLQKADLVTRSEAFLKQTTHGHVTLNEVRDQMGLNPYDGDLGNVPFMLSNLMPVQAIIDGTPSKEVPQDPGVGVDGDPGTRAGRCAGFEISDLRFEKGEDGRAQRGMEGHGRGNIPLNHQGAAQTGAARKGDLRKGALGAPQPGAAVPHREGTGRQAAGCTGGVDLVDGVDEVDGETCPECGGRHGLGAPQPGAAAAHRESRGSKLPVAPGGGPQAGMPVAPGGASQAGMPVARKTREIPDRVGLRGVFEPLFLEAFLRALKRENSEVAGAAERFLLAGDVAGFEGAMERFYDEQPLRMKDILRTVVEQYCREVARLAADEIGAGSDFEVGRFVDDALAELAAKWTSSSHGALKDILSGGGLPEEMAAAVEELLQRWPERAAGASKSATSKIETGLTKLVWMKGGVTEIRWQTSSPCPLCAPLGGKVVGIQQSFLPAGFELVPEGANPMSIKRDVVGPPLHGGCQCWLAPG